MKKITEFFHASASRLSPEYSTAIENVKKRRRIDETESNSESESNNAIVTISACSPDADEITSNCKSKTMSASNTPLTHPRNDIGYALGNSMMTAQERLNFLENCWLPPDNFNWPFTERMDKGKLRKKYLGKQHLTGQYEVFAYSTLKEGIRCKVCVLFAPDQAGGINLDRLVKSPLQKYSHLTGRDGYLTNHLTLAFHEDCLQRSQFFRQTMVADAGAQVCSSKKERRKSCRSHANPRRY
jgi:Pyruvate/2-oxoacid:ferredoxin oxidoreductase delta subunit